MDVTILLLQIFWIKKDTPKVFCRRRHFDVYNRLKELVGPRAAVADYGLERCRFNRVISSGDQPRTSVTSIRVMCKCDQLSFFGFCPTCNATHGVQFATRTGADRLRRRCLRAETNASDRAMNRALLLFFRLSCNMLRI